MTGNRLFTDEQVLDGFFAQWESDMEHNSGDEAVEDYLKANELQFFTDGRAYVY